MLRSLTIRLSFHMLFHWLKVFPVFYMDYDRSKSKNMSGIFHKQNKMNQNLSTRYKSDLGLLIEFLIALHLNILK